MQLFDTFWHKTLRRPYRLAKTVDQGSGSTVVLLHGIGRSGRVWQHVVKRLARRSFRVVAYDLLGFGASPKPAWLNYTIDDHASAVINSLEKLRLREPVILVGHSMGCLVALRVARLRPNLVKHLVLYEMPLYEGLPQKRRYKLRLDAYFRLYQKVIAYQPTFEVATAKMIERLGRRITGLEVDATTWQPFAKSLQNTIMQQTAPDDIKHVSVPMDVIYGSFDMLVIRGKPQEMFQSDHDRITAHTVRAGHVISDRASRFLVERIEVAEHPEQQKSTKRRTLRVRRFKKPTE